MDELNQIQNPNVTPAEPSPQVNISQQPSAPPMPSMNSSAPMSAPMQPMKKKGSWFIVAVVAIGAFGGYAWWYVGQMGEETMVFNQPKSNQASREAAIMSKEVQNLDTGNVDGEFKTIDSDLNSL